MKLKYRVQVKGLPIRLAYRLFHPIGGPGIPFTGDSLFLTPLIRGWGIFFAQKYYHEGGYA